MSTPRICLVTGGSSGIGRAAAHLLAERGDVVALLARGQDALDATADECRGRGAADVMTLACDVGDDTAVGQAVEAVIAQHGRLDLVIGAAGVVAYGRVDQVPAEVFDGLMRTNLLGTANLARHVVPRLREQDSGALVVVGSVVGHAVVPGLGTYAISKWALRALVMQLQVESRDRRGVHIGYVAPGSVDTPIYQQAAVYLPYAGRPPQPVVTPEAMARVVVKAAERRRPRVQYPLSNHVISLGFMLAPRLADAIVRPMFDVLAQDRSKPQEPTTGNVLAPVERREGVRGRYGAGLDAVRRDVAARWTRWRSA